MPLIWRHVFEATVAMLSVAQLCEIIHPSAHRKCAQKASLETALMDNSDGMSRFAGLRLHCMKQKFDKRVIVAHPWPGKRKNDTQFRYFTGQGERSHWGRCAGRAS